jgi:hypothetical protein
MIIKCNMSFLFGTITIFLIVYHNTIYKYNEINKNILGATNSQ